MDDKLKAWIADRLQRIPSAERFVLYHVSVEFGGGGEPLLQLEVGEQSEDKETRAAELEREVDSIGEDIHRTASQHCDAFDGIRQRYKVVAEAAGEPVSSFLFNRGAKMRVTSELGLSEPATERGLQGQLMRHNEAMAQQMINLVQAVVEPVISENQQLRRQRDQLEERRLETFYKLEELDSQKHVRDLEIRQFESERDRRDKFMKDLGQKWLPEIIKRIAFPAPAGSLPASPVDAEVPRMQGALRDVLAVLDRSDRDEIIKSLGDSERSLYDSLVGIGPAPESAAAFRAQLIAVWGALDNTLTDRISKSLIEKDQAKALVFLELLGIDPSAWTEKKEEPS